MISLRRQDSDGSIDVGIRFEGSCREVVENLKVEEAIRLLQRLNVLLPRAVPQPGLPVVNDYRLDILWDEREQRIAPFGRNGGVICDTDIGPCACGATHHEGEQR